MMVKRQLFHCLLAAVLGVVLTVALLWLGATAPAQANPGIRCVNSTGTGCGPACEGCYSSVQAAVNAAAIGDEIHVADGTYSRVGTVAVITKETVIIGGYAPDFSGFDPDMYQTVLDAGWGGSVISITNAGDVALEHLTLTRGNGSGNCPGGYSGCGGGIYATNTPVHVGHCLIIDNVGSTTESAAGGGIYVDNTNSSATADFWENQIVSNTASTANTGWGGGLFLIAAGPVNLATVTGNTIEDNTASTASQGYGGGLYLMQYATLSDNLFHHNYGNRTGGWGYGGALYLWEVGGATLDANRFLNNTASALGNGRGGAICGGADAVFTMTNNLVVGNHASDRGGGLCMGTFFSEYITGMLVNNTLVSNGAGAGGEGIWVGPYVSLVITNTIVADHTVGITNTAPASSTISADTNLFWNASDPIIGSNAIVDDPLLTSDYHPGEGSPAADAGLTIPWLTTDLDGAPRPQGSKYDIGALEGVRWEVRLPLVLKNL